MTNRRRQRIEPVAQQPVPQVFAGGRYRPLSDGDCDTIIESAFEILEKIGMADAPDWLVGNLTAKGAKQRDDGRLLLPRTMVEKALTRAMKKISLPGFVDHQGLEVGGGYVHIGTGGAAIQTLDSESSEYRDSTLQDLYDMMRLLDHCEHVHYGVRPLIARDMSTPIDLDINTAFACLAGTGKPFGISFDNSDHLEPVVRLFDMALDGKRQFHQQPFCKAIIVHVVPPLRFATEGVNIMHKAIALGMPLQICSAGQAGATSPATLAGALTQGLAESLAGLMVVDSIKPGFPCVFALMPFISDLRTGAMSGGSGEAAVASAASAQLLRRLELPSTVSAGMTDSKIGDAQSGYEKGYTVALAAQAGADMINLSVGMLGSIMVASPEALLIDNDMCGAILRTVRGIQVSDDMLDLDSIDRVVRGEGHYLGEAQTLQYMKSEYVYPRLGDRQSVDDWIDAGSQSIWDRANKSVESILRDDSPGHLSKQVNQKIRDQFEIKLNEVKT